MEAGRETAGREELWRENYEEGVRPELNFPATSAFSLLDRTVKRYPQRVAINFNGAKLFYRDLLIHTNRLATALSVIGVKKGDRVGVILPNCPQAVISYFAILRLGAAVVFINPMHVERELIYQLNDADVRVLIMIDTLYRRFSNIRDKVNVQSLVVTSIHDYLKFPYSVLYPLKRQSDGSMPEIPKREGIYRFNQLVRGAPPSPPEVEVHPKEDPALLMYTGGVTGTPKGAVITHYNIVSNVMQFREWFRACKDGEERVLGVVPFSHIYGLTCVLNFSVYIGATQILLPRFDLNQVLKIIDKTRPTFFPGVPTMYVAINNHPHVKKHHVSSIDYCLCGAAPLPLEVQEKFENLTGARLVEGYGLTEASPVTHCNPVRARRKVGSIGLPLPNTLAKIVDLEEGKEELEVGEVGELVIKGPQVMKEYWNKPEETELTLKDGWLHTGDIAEMDRDGYFFILNRKKDMIISGGYNIYPREVEEVLSRHSKVQEAVVTGVPDDYHGEVVKAYVFCKKGRKLLEDELKDYCLNKLARYKTPSIFEIRGEPPRRLTGPELRRYVLEGPREE